MKKIFGNFKKINWKTMTVTLVVTLAYPLIKAAFATGDPFTVISDILFIFSFALLLIGVFFTLYLHGDFDITKFLASRASGKNDKNYSEYKKDQDADRADAFNYPLFLGLVYLLISAFLGFVVVR